MAKPRLESMEIRPSKNGGHNVRHTFAPKASFNKGMSGGMSMAAPPAEEYNFGPQDHHNLLKHIAGALALKSMADNQAGEKASIAGKNPAQPNEEFNA